MELTIQFLEFSRWRGGAGSQSLLQTWFRRTFNNSIMGSDMPRHAPAAQHRICEVPPPLNGACQQGTVLIHSAEELQSYSETE